MKRFRIYAAMLIYILSLTGCSKALEKPASSSNDVLLPDDTLSPDDTSPFDDTFSPDGTLSSGDTSSFDDIFSPDDTLSPNDSLSPEDHAGEAYSSLLSGDNSLLDDGQLRKWGLEGWSDFVQYDVTYEYTYLDLDGDGVDELLIQLENDPCGYNAVFHYADGRLFCWENDMAGMSSQNYPLRDGTMVSQYDFNGTRSYTIFRYLSNGEKQELHSLFVREELIPENSDAPCPYYESDGTEVNQTAFEEQLEELITAHLLDRSVWTIL